jgi:antitoxin (DNA-binding transcriptional repressor) of toxin-antitoxin stability system
MRSSWTTSVTIHSAKMNLSRFIARVEAGEGIVVARDTEPVEKPAKEQASAPSHD